MLTIIRLITVVFLALGCHSKTKQSVIINQPFITINDNDLPSDSLISIKYKVINERHAFRFDDRNKNRKYLAEIDGYDQDKNLIEHKSYRFDGDIQQHVVYIYENGLLLNEYRLSGEVLYKTIYGYDSNRKLAYSTIVNFQKRLKKDTPEWKDNLDGSDFEKTKSWGEKRTTTYTYDLKQRLVETQETTGFSPEEVETFKYDDEDRVIEELTTNGGIISRKITTKYFKDSLEITCIFYPYESGNICKKRFDKNNNLLVEQCIETDTKKSMLARNYFYDSKQRINKEEYITDRGVPILTLYDYKENVKPIQRIFTVNNQ